MGYGNGMGGVLLFLMALSGLVGWGAIETVLWLYDSITITWRG